MPQYVPPPLIHMSAADAARRLTLQAARLKNGGEHMHMHPKTAPWLAATSELGAAMHRGLTVRDALRRTRRAAARVQNRITRLQQEEARRKAKQRAAERAASRDDPPAAAGALAVAAASSVAVIARQIEMARASKLRVDQAVQNMQDSADMHGDAFPPSSDFPSEYPMEIWTTHGAEDELCLMWDGAMFEPGVGPEIEGDTHPNCKCTRDMVMVQF